MCSENTLGLIGGNSATQGTYLTQNAQNGGPEWGALARAAMGDDISQLATGHLRGAFSYGLRNFEARDYFVSSKLAMRSYVDRKSQFPSLPFRLDNHPGCGAAPMTCCYSGKGL
jgi:hypothetical protein